MIAGAFGLRRVTELPDSLPRIDSVVSTSAPTQRLVAGANATIIGDGLSSVSAVNLLGRSFPIVTQTETGLEVAIPVDLPFPELFSAGADLQLDSSQKTLRQVRIRIYPPTGTPAQP